MLYQLLHKIIQIMKFYLHSKNVNVVFLWLCVFVCSFRTQQPWLHPCIGGGCAPDASRCSALLERPRTCDHPSGNVTGQELQPTASTAHLHGQVCVFVCVCVCVWLFVPVCASRALLTLDRTADFYIPPTLMSIPSCHGPSSAAPSVCYVVVYFGSNECLLVSAVDFEL